MWVLYSVQLEISLSDSTSPTAFHSSSITHQFITCISVCTCVPPACVISRADVWSPAPCKWIPVRRGHRTWPHKNRHGNRFQTSSCGPWGRKWTDSISPSNQCDSCKIFFLIMLIMFNDYSEAAISNILYFCEASKNTTHARLFFKDPSYLKSFSNDIILCSSWMNKVLFYLQKDVIKGSL